MVKIKRTALRTTSPISTNWVIIIVCTDIYHMTVTWFHSPERVKLQNSKHFGCLFLCHLTCHRKGHKKNVITKIRFSDFVWCNLCTSSEIHHSAWQRSRLFCKSYKRLSSAKQHRSYDVTKSYKRLSSVKQHRSYDVTKSSKRLSSVKQHRSYDVTKSSKRLSLVKQHRSYYVTKSYKRLSSV